MKKLFLLLFSSIFCFGNIVAEQILVEKKWETSINEGSTPSWMGGTTERSMAIYDGKLYIASRNGGNKIIIIDTNDGSLINTINVSNIANGTLKGNTIGLTSDGKILLGNGAGKAFAIQIVDENTGAATDLLSSPASNITAGRVDGWAVYGTLDDGFIVVPASPVSGTGGEEILIFTLEDGSVANPTAPIKITTKNGASASAFIVDDKSFYTFSQTIIPQLFIKDTSGWVLAPEQFTGAVKPGNGASSGGQVTYKSNTYFASSKDRFGNLQIFDITNGLTNPTNEFNGSALGNAANTALTAPICTEVKSDGAYVYMMATNNGVAAYRIYSDSEVGIKDVINDENKISLSNAPNPAKSITSITYYLPEAAQVELIVRDVTGRKIATLVNEKQAKGEYSVSFDVNSLNEGLYIYQLNTNGKVSSKKMIVKK